MNQQDLIDLRDQITNYFNRTELGNLCFDLGINYEFISGDSFLDKVRELISYCSRHNLLEPLSQRCAELRPHISWPYSNNDINPRLPINDKLLTVMELYKEVCKKKNIYFYTPNLFLALLDIQNGITQRALNQLRLGLATELRERLVKYTIEILPQYADKPFLEFDWMEREDVMQAQKWASDLDAKNVSEKHLLLGMLNTNSNTMTSLRAQIGDEGFKKLKQIVENMPDIEPTHAYITPGPPIF